MVVTLKDIADATGKSVTTVSRALNNEYDVSEKTKAYINQVAQELGYSPNTWAQRLQKKRTDTIGLILPTFGPRFSDPFFSELLAGIGNKAATLGFDILVSTRAPGDEELQAYQNAANGRRVDGFILVRTRRQDERIHLLQKLDFPFVSFGRSEGVSDFPFVDEDGALGMKALVRHLVDLGHERIACIAPSPELMFAHYRLLGFKEGLSEFGKSYDDSMIIVGDLTQGGGYEAACKLLDSDDPPTAIAACNDMMAFGAISAAQERGLVIGKDISITGFDDVPGAEFSHPPLTTLHQPLYIIGGMVCDMLVQKIKGEELVETNVLLKPELIIRQSTGKRET